MPKNTTVTLIHFLSDILKSEPDSGLQFVQHTYWQDPELVMRFYKLTDDQQNAVKSGDIKQIMAALQAELDGFQQAQNRDPDW